MNVVERRLGEFVVGRRHSDAPLPPLVEGLYIRLGHPRQAVEPPAGHKIHPVHRQVLVERMVHVERQEGRPQLLAVALLLHAVHLQGLGDAGRLMLDAGQGFAIVQLLPQGARIGYEQHVAIHEQGPPRHPETAAQLRHQEPGVAELRAERAAVALVVGLAGGVRHPGPAEKGLVPQRLMLQHMHLDRLAGEALDAVG